MEQNNNEKNNLKGQISGSDEKRKEGMEDWRNQHGQPSFPFLQALADEGTLEAFEKLRFIAEDLDVTYDVNTSAEELVGKIRKATQKNSTDVIS